VREELLTSPKISILIHMKEKAIFDKNELKNMDHSLKGHFMVYKLRQVSTSSQEKLKGFLDSIKIPYTSFWISNVIHIESADKELIEMIASRDDVKKIVADLGFKVDLETQQEVSIPSAADEPEWNVKHINAHILHEKGFRGKGSVVASADTGVDFTHEAIMKQYRGYQGSHDYNWWDGVKVPHFTRTNPCGYNSTKPCDDSGHGTHTVGTMCGEATGRKIGVAPDAKWIGCRMMEGGYARPVTILSCLQFFMAPTDLRGNNPNPDKRPHSTGHSYGCASTRCPDPEAMKEAVENLRNAGIFVNVAAGNSGPSCSSVDRLPSHYDASFTVCATGYQTDKVASFSSRGPVKIDGSQRRKPDICAPGERVTSCIPGGKYTAYSGTSMATPGVTGAIALLYSALPHLVREVDKTQEIIQLTAHHQESTDCGSSTKSPNNVYGYGTIDVAKAYEFGKKF